MLHSRFVRVCLCPPPTLFSLLVCCPDSPSSRAAPADSMTEATASNGVGGHSAAAAAAAPPHRRVIDLRSDTVTRPTAAMRSAMAAADVGDDVYGDDPTVNLLQAKAAAMAGKEAALFVPSGTMGNLICVLTHCRERGDEFIVGDQAHIQLYEQGGSASLGSVHARVVRTATDGSLELQSIEAAVRTLDDHFPVTRLICLENTHNRCGGRVLQPDYVQAVADIARRHQLKLHIDGARICNAAAALGLPVSRLLQPADSASICLSKGLAAPVGSVIVGSRDFILRAKRLRKALGGGMRQAGVIAAAAIIALEQMQERLTDDHSNARRLAAGLEAVPGLQVRAADVETNIVYVRVDDAAFGLREVELQQRLKDAGIWIGVSGVGIVRMVTHYEITEEDVQQVIDAVVEIGKLKGGKQ